MTSAYIAFNLAHVPSLRVLKPSFNDAHYFCLPNNCKICTFEENVRVSDSRLALCQGACLVKDHDLDTCSPFQRICPL